MTIRQTWFKIYGAKEWRILTFALANPNYQQMKEGMELVYGESYTEDEIREVLENFNTRIAVNLSGKFNEETR